MKGTTWEIQKHSRTLLHRNGITLTLGQLRPSLQFCLFLAGIAFICTTLFDVGESQSAIEAGILAHGYATSILLLVSAFLTALLQIHLQSIPIGSVGDGNKFLWDIRYAFHLSSGLCAVGIMSFVCFVSLVASSRIAHDGLRIAVITTVLATSGLLVTLFWLLLTYWTDPKKYRNMLAQEVPDPKPKLLRYIKRLGLDATLQYTLAFACAQHRIGPKTLSQFTEHEDQLDYLRQLGISKLGPMLKIREALCNAPHL